MTIPKGFREFGRALFVLTEGSGDNPDTWVPLAGITVPVGGDDAGALGSVLFGSPQRNNISYNEVSVDDLGSSTLSTPQDRFGLNTLSLLFAADTGVIPNVVRRLQCDSQGRLNVNAGQSQADAIITAADQSVGTGSATQIAAANASRRTIIVQNLDGTNFIRVGDSNVSASRGIVVAAGESITLENTAAVFAIADTAAVNVAVLENDVTP